ncbi:hypothetical protein RUM43_007648 [Polyplax serrata]|uniref:Uncharacterized protein n=1 Tax=Polyplax serrata TaxID=468196 RepID=A0AAN8S5N3_POLSC
MNEKSHLHWLAIENNGGQITWLLAYVPLVPSQSDHHLEEKQRPSQGAVGRGSLTSAEIWQPPETEAVASYSRNRNYRERLRSGDLENLKTEKDPFFYVQRKTGVVIRRRKKAKDHLSIDQLSIDSPFPGV